MAEWRGHCGDIQELSGAGSTQPRHRLETVTGTRGFQVKPEACLQTRGQNEVTVLTLIFKHWCSRFSRRKLNVKAASCCGWTWRGVPCALMLWKRNRKWHGALKRWSLVEDCWVLSRSLGGISVALSSEFSCEVAIKE